MARRAKAPPETKIEIAATSDETKESILTRSVLSYKDVAEQPRGQYFVILDLNQRSLLFTADIVEVREDSVALFINTDVNPPSSRKKIVEFHSSLPWYAVSADYAGVISMEQMTRRSVADQLALEKLHDSLIPADDSERPTRVMAEVPGATVIKTGQYL